MPEVQSACAASASSGQDASRNDGFDPAQSHYCCRRSAAASSEDSGIFADGDVPRCRAIQPRSRSATACATASDPAPSSLVVARGAATRYPQRHLVFEVSRLRRRFVDLLSLPTADGNASDGWARCCAACRTYRPEGSGC